MKDLKNILVLTGSASKGGTSLLLASEFEKGALLGGNKVKRYDSAFLNVGVCKNCSYCKENGGDCIQKDDFDLIKKDLLSSDLVVFVTPIYYFGMSAQLKTVIDRFHCISDDLKGSQKSAMLIATQASFSESVADALVLHYEKIIDYLKWGSEGVIIAKGVPTKQALEATDYPKIVRQRVNNLC